MRFPICAAAIALVAAPTHAQDEDQQIWFKLSAKTALSENVDLGGEINQRLGNDRNGLYESQYAVKADLKLPGGFKLTGGVNRVIGLTDRKVANTEWRPRQELGFPALRIGPGELASRVRFEQRFRNDGDDVGHRVRPEFIYTLPMSPKLDLEIAHESYFNLNTTDFGQKAGNERMRNFAALVFPLIRKVKASVGYMNQYRFNQGQPDKMEHALTLAASATF